MTQKLDQHGMMDMTSGKPLKLIVVFSIPLLMGNVLQQLYNMVDSMVVGNYVGAEALAAVGTGFPIIFMLTSLFMGLGIGATIMISQFKGANNHENIKNTIDTIYSAMVIGAIPLTIFGILISAPLLHSINVPANTFDQANLYVMIILAGVIGNLGYNVNAGILQGLGDSKTPLLFLAIACVLNIILDLLFVVVFHWGVAGVAIATIIAQMVSWVFGIVYINKKYPQYHIHPFSFRFHKDLFRRILQLGIPAGIQQAFFSIGVMVLQSLVNSYGSSFMAGYNGANKLDTFAFMPIQSFATAATTFVGQNIGASRMDRVKEGTMTAIILSCVVSIVVAILFVPLGPLFMRLFSQDPQVIHAGMAYLYRVMPFFFLLSISFILNGIMRGAGEMIIPMLSSIVSLWLARIPAAYLMVHFFGRDNMFYCFVIGWIIGLFITVPYFVSGRWKKKAIAHGELAQNS